MEAMDMTPQLAKLEYVCGFFIVFRVQGPCRVKATVPWGQRVSL